MAQPSIHDVLTNSLSPEAGVRSAATQQLESFAATAFPDYLQALNAELVNESAPSHIRNAAGLAIKNALTAREAHTKDALAQRWIALQDSARLHIKNSALGSLGSNDRGARNVAGQIIAAIAIIELPHNAWPDLIDQLMSFSQQPNASLKQATLQTIGYICEAIVRVPFSRLLPGQAPALIHLSLALCAPETRNSCCSIQQNSHRRCSRRSQGGREPSGPAGRLACPQQLP